MVDKRKIKKIVRTSKKVLTDCSLNNGAIVASNINDPDYPKDVKSYYYVWPRDASFICVAADFLRIKNVQKKFFRWCWENAELFRETGVFLSQKFYPHGRMAGDYDINLKFLDIKNKRLIKIAKHQTRIRLYYTHFQPDQVGSLLWAIHHHSKFESVNEFKEMIIKAADGICSYWKGSYFKIPTIDLWEEKAALPNLTQVHVYSLAQCVNGLNCAMKLVKPKNKWIKCSDQMRKIIEKSYSKRLKYFVKIYGKKIDRTIDSSSLGLVWPCEIFDPNDSRIMNTVKKILQKNKRGGGIYRYKDDKYDGRINSLKLALGGGGAWPLLNFWMSIYYMKSGNEKEAKKYYDWVIKRVDKKLPEQIKNNKPTSIIPLAWSHAMFIIASKFLGYI